MKVCVECMWSDIVRQVPCLPSTLASELAVETKGVRRYVGHAPCCCEGRVGLIARGLQVRWQQKEWSRVCNVYCFYNISLMNDGDKNGMDWELKLKWEWLQVVEVVRGGLYCGPWEQNGERAREGTGLGSGTIWIYYIITSTCWQTSKGV